MSRNEKDQESRTPLLRQRNVPAQSTGTSSSSSTTTTDADTDPTITIRTVTPRLTTFSRPFARFGFVPIGGRSTAVQLRDGTVWLLASTPLDARTRAKLQEMGDVRYIVAPDVEHHLFLPQYAAEYPQAKVIGVEGLEEKHKELEFAGLYGRDPEGTEYGFEDEIQAQYFPTFANRDVVFNHIDTKTLITADLLFNLPPNEQYAATPAGKATSRIPFLMMVVNRVKPSSWLHKAFLGAAGAGAGIPGVEKGGSKQERRQRFARDAAAVASWDFDRVVMCHGDVIESGGKEAWLSAFAKYLNEDGTPKAF